MANEIAVIILAGLLANYLFARIGLPGLLGMLCAGVLLGPQGFGIISPGMLALSSDLREIALIVILLRAGFEISAATLKKIGRTSLFMSFVPAVFEGAAITLLSVQFLGMTYLEGAMLGAIIAAVSPAVVVPYMIDFIQRGLGRKRNVPSIIIAASSVDDVFVIVIFSVLTGIYTGKNTNIALQLLNIPVSIVLGMAAGAALGILLVWFFKKFHIRDTKKVLILTGISILLLWAEDAMKDKLAFAALLGIMTIGVVILEKYEKLAVRLGEKFKKVWVLAEIILFVTVGAQVNISVVWKSGVAGLLIIFIALLFRSAGVVLSLAGSGLTRAEKFLCVISYIPKATVQAAIGAIPLALGVPAGDTILAVSVLAIAVTAPIGAAGIKYFGERILREDGPD